MYNSLLISISHDYGKNFSNKIQILFFSMNLNWSYLPICRGWGGTKPFYIRALILRKKKKPTKKLFLIIFIIINYKILFCLMSAGDVRKGQQWVVTISCQVVMTTMMMIGLITLYTNNTASLRGSNLSV